MLFQTMRVVVLVKAFRENSGSLFVENINKSNVVIYSSDFKVMNMTSV